MTHMLTVINTPATRIDAQCTDTYVTRYTDQALAELASTLQGYSRVTGAQIVMWPFTDRKVN